jgi:hypothetical protein
VTRPRLFTVGAVDDEREPAAAACLAARQIPDEHGTPVRARSLLARIPGGMLLFGHLSRVRMRARKTSSKRTKSLRVTNHGVIAADRTGGGLTGNLAYSIGASSPNEGTSR